MAPTGSSNFNLSTNATANTINAPAIKPITIASVTLMISAPAVIPTKPPRIPFKNIDKSYSLYLNKETKNADKPPEAAAKQVVTNTNDVFPGSAESTEPPLNPNQPSHKINTPAVANGIL